MANPLLENELWNSLTLLRDWLFLSASQVDLLPKSTRLEEATPWPILSQLAESRLAAVPVQGALNRLHDRVGSDASATQIATAFLRHSHGQVASTGGPVLRLARGGQTKSLLGSLVSLLLRHGPVTPCGAPVDTPGAVH